MPNQRTLRPGGKVTPRAVSGLALWLDASQTGDLYTTDAGPVTAVSAPTEISGCVLWLDGSDSSAASMTLNGSLVETWKDKSATGAVLTASGSARPTLSAAGFKSRQAVVFNGSSTTMASASAYTATNSLTGMTRIAVCAHTTNAISALSRVYDGGSDFFLYMNGFARSYVSNGANFVGFAPHGNSNILPEGLYADTYSSSALSFYSSGAGVSGTVNGTVPATTGSGSPTLHVGSNAGVNFFWNGPIAEVIYFNRALTRAELAQIEAYLAAKWGISGVHRSATQEIAAVSSPLEVGGCAGWWDASRTDKMWSATSGGSLVDNGGAVLRLEDLSGNGKHLIQAVSASAPSRQDSAKNGLPVLNFGGTKSLAAGAAGDWNFLHNTNGGTVIAVIKPFDTADPQTFAYGVSTNLGGGSNGIGWSSFFDDRVAGYSRNNYLSQSVMAGVSGQSVAVQDQNNALTQANDFSLLSFTPFAGSSTTAGRGAMYVSGTATGSANTSTLAPSTSNSSSALLVGVAGTNSIAGLAELIVFNTVLSAVDRARVEKYLANKWGITGVPDPTPPVGYWRDRSGNGRHAVQATGSRRPLIGSQNNRRAMTFDGSDDNVSLTPSVAVASSGYTVVAAIKHNLTSQPLYLSSPLSLTSGNGGRPIERWQGGSSQSIVTIGAVTSNVAGSYRSFAERFVYGLDALKDGVSSGTHQVREFLNGATNFDVSNNGTWSVSSQRINVGTRDDGNTQYKGDICELCLYDRRLTTAERQRLERYLAAKWGITLAPQVSNADAQDWINRVYANGGTVSRSTAAYVNAFCDAIDTAGLRSKFYRLNAFCGNADASLIAVRTPLYCGPSASTTFGNALDTNTNFVVTDYSESTGLQGSNNNLTGPGKFLRTGLTTNVIGFNNLHLGAGILQHTTSSIASGLLGATPSGGYAVGLFDKVLSGSVARFGSATSSHAGPSGSLSSGGYVMSYPNLYAGGLLQGNYATTFDTGSASHDFFVFACNNGSGSSTTVTNSRLGWYSIGTAFASQSEVQAFTQAITQLQLALGRFA